MMLKSINPATKELLIEINEWSPKQVTSQISETKRSQHRWNKTPFAQKTEIITHVGDILHQQQKQLATLIALEMGKPIQQAEAELLKCRQLCTYFAEHVQQFLQDELVPTEAESSIIRCKPLGVILGIMPWNFPFWQVFRFAVPALLAGNTTLLKHASNVPQCAQKIQQIFQQANLPKNAFVNLPISSQQLPAHLTNPDINAISLTGSTTAGKTVAAYAGKHLKKIVLELGGSDPFIILKDADIEFTAEQAVIARMQNNGQSCIAAKRFIIEKPIYEEFTTTFIEKIKQLKIGNPLDPTTNIGPLAREDLVTEITKQINQSITQGAQIKFQNPLPPHLNGFYFPPTVLTNITADMPVFHSETFGPAVPLISAHNQQEAITLANKTPYGLGASIWTTNTKHAENLIQHIEAGMIFINDIVKSDPRLPFGGIKESGFGRELSQYGIKEFVNLQTIWKNKQPPQKQT